MTPELTALACAGLLQIVQIFLMAVPANLELGSGATLNPRDPGPGKQPLAEMLSIRTGRLYRAMNNHFEALILFSIAVVVVTLGDASSLLTQACAWVYVAARVAYIPAYAYGLVPWRSLLWSVGLLATFLMLIASLI